MGLGLFGALANGYNGFQKGQDAELDRQQLAEDRAYQKSQRAYQTEAQTDESAGRKRANALRADLIAIPEERTSETPQMGPGLEQADGSEAPMAPLKTTTKVPLDEQLRLAASAHRKAGNLEGYLTATSQADKIGYDRSAKTANAILAASEGMTPLQLANAAKDAFDGDPFPGKISTIIENPDGSVNVTAANRDTGQATTKTFKTSAELRDGILAHYSPENYATLQANRLAEARKLREEDNKVHIIPAGGEAIKSNGKSLGVNDNGYTTVINPDGTTSLVKTNLRLGGAGGVGAGAKPGKSELDAAMKTIIEAPGASLPQEQVSKFQLYGEQIFNSGATASVKEAAAVAYDAATHPERITTKLNVKTGTWDQYYQNPALAGGKNIAIAPNISDTTAATRGMDHKSTQGAVSGLLSSMGTREQQEKFLRAAHDPDYRKAMEAAAEGQGVDMATLRRKLDLLKLLPAPAGTPVATPPGQPASKPGLLSTALGLGGTGYTPPAGSPAARAQALRDQARDQANRKSDQLSRLQQDLSSQFAQDSQLLSPLELVRKYDTLRLKLAPQDAAALRAAEQKL